MGWLYYAASREALVADLTKTRTYPDHTITCIRQCFRGNNLWTVFERTWTNGDPPDRHIVLFLMQKEERCGWGYKDIDETCGPCEVSCPVSYLDLVPDPGGYATHWRKRVREVQAMKSLERGKMGELRRRMRVGLVAVYTQAEV